MTLMMAVDGRMAVAHTLDADDQPAIVVRVDNLAAISATTLQFAEERAAEIFRRIGVRVRWVDQDTVVEEHLHPPFTVLIVERGDRRMTMLDGALGFAEPQLGRAYVLLSPIGEINARSRRTTPSIMGDVMAHELGHLLLPSPGHSRDGIMRPGVTLSLRAMETFTKPQADEITARLRR